MQLIQIIVNILLAISFVTNFIETSLTVGVFYFIIEYFGAELDHYVTRIQLM